jgi:protein-tyrosine phosphatase
MRQALYWVATGTRGRIATMTRPRGGDWLAGELITLRTHGIDMVVSLLTQGEADELDLADESRLAAAADLEFLAFPILDYAVPPLDAATVAFVERLALAVQSGRTIAVHCRIGIGRSSLIVASVLGLLGMPSAEAFARIATARGRSVPDTAEQREWVDRFLVARDWFR